MAKAEDPSQTIPHQRTEPRPEFSNQPQAKKLSPELQSRLDSLHDQNWYESIASGDAGESTDSNVRYAAYAARLRTIMMSVQRYVAYTSDIGESFRPVAHPNLVRAAYGISWAYLGGDVAYEGYKAYKRNQEARNAPTQQDSQFALAALPQPRGQRVAAIDDYRAVMAQRAVFQSIASMGLPAFTIHSIVRYSGQALKNAKNARLRTWGPIGLGLAAVPALPFMFDKPIEHATEWVFHTAFEAIGGPQAVGKDEAGRGPGLKEKHKEKEL